MCLFFEWDEHKAQINKKKHGVSFELAARIFADPNAFSHQDRFENGEYRWQTIGMVEGCLILLVAHTVKSGLDGEVIRIISARKATKQEQKLYDKYNL